MFKHKLLHTLAAGLTAIAVGSTAYAADFDGPSSGPTAAADKTIVVLAADLKNGGILGVTNGVEEAAKVIGWEVRVLDGADSTGWSGIPNWCDCETTVLDWVPCLWRFVCSHSFYCAKFWTGGFAVLW